MEMVEVIASHGTPGTSTEQWRSFLRTTRHSYLRDASRDPFPWLAAQPNPAGLAAELAHYDVSRTLDECRCHCSGKLSESSLEAQDLFHRCRQELVESFLLELASNPPSSAQQFDNLHRRTCELLISKLNMTGVRCHVHLGQAQKWLNMALKYAHSFGANVLPGISESWKLSHVPIDNYVSDYLRRRFPQLSRHLDLALSGKSWSRMSEYDLYLAFQGAVRAHAGDRAPLALECDWWDGENATRRADARCNAVARAATEPTGNGLNETAAPFDTWPILAQEHYLVARDFGHEKNFSTAEFKSAYRLRFPSRPEVSMNPSDYTQITNKGQRNDRERAYPQFLQKEKHATYRFVDVRRLS